MSDSPPYAKQRRSPRFSAVTPVDVEWRRHDGLRVRESAETEVVSAHGGLLRLKAQIQPQTQIILRELTSHETLPARVIWVIPAGQDGLPRIAVELSTPSETFWKLGDRRRTPRYQIRPDTFAYFYPADEESTGLVRNLSLGGVYIEDAHNEFTEGTGLELELNLDNEKISLRGVVTRTYPHKGFALRFEEQSAEAKDLLERYLRHAGA